LTAQDQVHQNSGSVCHARSAVSKRSKRVRSRCDQHAHSAGAARPRGAERSISLHVLSDSRSCSCLKHSAEQGCTRVVLPRLCIILARILHGVVGNIESLVSNLISTLGVLRAEAGKGADLRAQSMHVALVTPYGAGRTKKLPWGKQQSAPLLCRRSAMRSNRRARGGGLVSEPMLRLPHVLN